jgi:hypothetical protein
VPAVQNKRLLAQQSGIVDDGAEVDIQGRKEDAIQPDRLYLASQDFSTPTPIAYGSRDKQSVERHR